MQTCIVCGGKIPRTRKASAKYCSDEHYYSVKKNRSRKQYANASSWIKEIKLNEDILKTFYPLAYKKGGIDYEDFEVMNFNSGISSGETLYKDKICKIVLSYVYHIDRNTKKIFIWKLQLGQ